MEGSLSTNNWEKYELGEMAVEVRNLFEPVQNEELPYIGLEHIDQNTLKFNSIGQSKDTVSTKKKFLPGDILFGTLRPYFRKVVRPKFKGVCSTDITVVRAKENCTSGFLFYFIANHSFIDYATSISTGTRMPRASWKTLSESNWQFPPLPTQRKIAAILSAYDDLIENNLRRIKILEEMAQNLYREWFVKFRFPGHEQARFVDSEMGRIPEGWEVKRLSETCTLIMGQSPKSEFYNTIGAGLPFHQGVTDFGNRFPKDRMFCTVENRVAEPGDILFSVRAPVGRINLSDKKIVIGRGLSAIRENSGNQWFLFHFLKDKFQKEDIMGGGAIFNSVTKNDMEGIQILYPTQDIIDFFEGLATPLNDKAGVLTKKNNSLRHTRDLLLPRLISGEVDVSDLDINMPNENGL